MPFNMVGFGEATPGAGTVPVAVGGGEQLYSLLDAGDSILVTEATPFVLGLFASGIATMGAAILRQPGKTDKAVIKSCLQTDNDPAQGFSDFMKTPLVLKPKAKLTALSVNAADEDTLIGIMLGTGPFPRRDYVIDEVISGFADVTIAAASTWMPVPITWNKDPPEGVYSIVGMRGSAFLAANLWSALMRLVIPGHPEYRPGVPVTLAEADHEEMQSQTYEPWVNWGQIGIQFKAPEQMPNAEILSTSLITDENIELRLMRVG